jgi:hypothetical protein
MSRTEYKGNANSAIRESPGTSRRRGDLAYLDLRKFRDPMASEELCFRCADLFSDKSKDSRTDLSTAERDLSMPAIRRREPSEVRLRSRRSAVTCKIY